MGKRDETEKRLWELLCRLKETKTPITVTEFCKLGGKSRSYLYRFRELAAEVAEYAKETQPKRSRRGAGAKKRGEAKKRDVEERLRREHAQWSKELPKLIGRIEELEANLEKVSGEKREVDEERDRLRRLIELLLLLASEAGVDPIELEEINKKVG